MAYPLNTSQLPKLNEASKKKIERLIATVNQWPELELDNYLEDHPSKAKSVAQTLKHYANPLAEYPVDDHFVSQYNSILIAFDDPKKLAPNMHYLQLTHEEEIYLKELMKIKFDQLANETMMKYKINPSTITVPQSAQGSPHQAAPPTQPLSREDQWWQSKSPAQKSDIQSQYQNLNSAQSEHLNRRMHYVYAVRQPNYTSDSYRYYQMAMIDAELRYLSIRLTLDLTELTLRLIGMSAKSAFEFGSAYASNFNLSKTHNSSKNSDKSDEAKAILATAAFFAFGAMAIVGCAYGIKKLYNSTRNLLLLRKPLRSIVRILSIMAGGVAGTYIGAPLGASLASAIPSLALATGITLGMVFGAALFAGVFALAAKYLCKAISYYYYQDELNPTNPDKWRLSTAQIHSLTAEGIDVNRVKQEIKEIKHEKAKLGIEGSMFWTTARERKNQLNDRLAMITKKDTLIRQYPPRYDFFAPCLSADRDTYQSTLFRV